MLIFFLIKMQTVAVHSRQPLDELASAETSSLTDYWGANSAPSAKVVERVNNRVKPHRLWGLAGGANSSQRAFLAVVDVKWELLILA